MFASDLLSAAVKFVIQLLPLGGKSWTAKRAREALESGTLPVTPIAKAYAAEDVATFMEGCGEFGKGKSPGLKCLADEDCTQGCNKSVWLFLDSVPIRPVSSIVCKVKGLGTARLKGVSVMGLETGDWGYNCVRGRRVYFQGEGSRR